VARSTVAAALKRLEALGVIERVKRRVRVAWGGGVASRQGVSSYVMRVPPDTEFDGRPVGRSVNLIVEMPQRAVAAAQAALAERRRVVERALLTRNKAPTALRGYAIERAG
jgi:DNA-binding Lrp family transcriptional regulator